MKLMKKYDLAAIMRDAWNIRKAAAAEMGCTMSAVHMSGCLKQAWQKAKTAAANSPAAVRAAWNRQTGKEQDLFLRKMITKAADDAIARTVSSNKTADDPDAPIKPGYAGYNEVIAWTWDNKDIPDIVSEAYIYLMARFDRLEQTNAARAAKGKPPTALASLVYNAARDAISKFYRDDIKHGRANVRTVKDSEGVERSYINEMVRDRTQSTEAAAIARVTLDRFSAQLDDIDKAIIECAQNGLTLHQTAAHVSEHIKQISYVAIHKRLEKIRGKLAAEIA